MLLSPRLRAILMASALIGASALTARAEDCTRLLDSFNQAIDARQEDEAQRIVDRIATDARCGRFQVAAQRRLAAYRLKAAQLLMARGRPVGEYERLLVASDRPGVLWQAAATMGEVRFGERRFAEAARAFDKSIEIVKNETFTPAAPPRADIVDLIDRAAQSRLLAANASSGKGETFVKTARNERDGKLGGVYSPNVRGVVAQAIPIPITFDYAKVSFTRIGMEAARELAIAIKEQTPSRVVLVGHTDVRGSSETNMRLSRERADAVATFLREQGLQVAIETVGKGETEPMHLANSSGLTQEDIYALNRRVEWRRD